MSKDEEFGPKIGNRAQSLGPHRPYDLLKSIPSVGPIPSGCSPNGLLDRRRAAPDDASRSAARLARAEAQVWAIVGDRLRARLLTERDGTGTRDLLEAVAEHRLDPFSAADELIGRATGS